MYFLQSRVMANQSCFVFFHGIQKNTAGSPSAVFLSKIFLLVIFFAAQQVFHVLKGAVMPKVAHHFQQRVAQCQLVHYFKTAFLTMLPARLMTPSATLIGMVSYEPACQSRTFLRWMASNLHFVVHRPQPMHR